MKFPAILFLLVAIVLTATGQSASTNAAQASAASAICQMPYRVDSNTFTSMRRLVTGTNALSDGQALLSYFKQNGIELSVPSSWFYTHGKKSLVVRSTKENLDKIEIGSA